MANTYHEEELLLLSGIQHIAFCERQWALIFIEQAWEDNVLTIDGHHMHERTDDPFLDETRKNIRVVRSMPIVSYELGLRGVADVVEFKKEERCIEGITISLGRKGVWWRPYPVEYKRGRPKQDDRDAVQLCAQAIALEEMFKVKISVGYLYYGQTRRRIEVVLDSSLRERTKRLADQMHQMLAEGKTPKASKGKHCPMCSLSEICQPNLSVRHNSVTNYLAKMGNLEVNDY